MKQMQVAVFDFDYTLADSSRGVVDCVTHTLTTSGLPVPQRQQILAAIGLSLPEIFHRFAPGTPPDQLLPIFKARADTVMEDMTSVYGETAPTVAALKQRGWRLAIASTKFRYRIEAVLRRDQLLQQFDLVVGGEDVSRHKPDPECLLTVMERLQAVPEDIIYVGDSIMDGLAAGAAGVKFVAVLTGVTPREQLLEHNPVAVLQHLAELVPLLEQLN